MAVEEAVRSTSIDVIGSNLKGATATGLLHPGWRLGLHVLKIMIIDLRGLPYLKWELWASWDDEIEGICSPVKFSYMRLCQKFSPRFVTSLRVFILKTSLRLPSCTIKIEYKVILYFLCWKSLEIWKSWFTGYCVPQKEMRFLTVELEEQLKFLNNATESSSRPYSNY